jgi:acyl-CoA synthetase (AMP-forming)/AMP-acid ligase II/thioesterase domain-containing protein/acyl carrier protein
MNHQIEMPDTQRVFDAVPLPLEQTTLGTAIRLRAETHPDQPAIVTTGFAPLSYRQLQSLIQDVRVTLRTAGLGRSARIAVAMPNGPHAALAIVAVACSAVSIPLNPRQTLREIETGFAALPPDAVLLVKGGDSIVRRVAERLGITILEAVRSLDGVLGIKIDQPQSAAAAALGEPDEPDPDAPAFILQTSGTTAAPKLIPTSHRNMLAAAARVQTWFDLTPRDRCLCVSPVFYAHGLHVMIFTPLLTGGSIAFPTDATRFDAEWFDALKPTWYSASPTLHRLVLDQSAATKVTHSLRFILSGGAPLPWDLLGGLQQALGVLVVEHYGSSEGMQICSNQLAPGRSRPGTVGIPAPDTVIIAADDGSKLPPGQQGEVLVGGPTVVAGYLNAPELSQASFVNGWFKSGDIGSIDDDGFLTLHGRKDDLINRGGEKISPAEIDEALLRHPKIAEAAAFSVAHPRLGQDVAAAVVLRPGMTATAMELRKYLQGQLAPFKVPGKITVHDQLPKGKTGKILRRQLGASPEEKPAAEVNAVAETTTAAPVLDKNSAMSTLVTQLKEIWERLLKISPISIDDDFSDRGGDSLLAMEMLSDVERLTGHTIPTSTLFEARTIRQLAQILFEQRIQPKSIIEFNSGGKLPPIFLYHGDYFGGLYAAKLANSLGADQPLFTIAPHDLGTEPVLLSIEEMAADSLSSILNAQPKGPYRLYGYCIGGLVAFEAARLLIAAGEKVEFVGMIDTPTISARRYVQLLLSAMRRTRPIAGSVIDRVVPVVFHKLSRLDRPWRFSIAQRTASIANKVRRAFGRHNSQIAAEPPKMSTLRESRIGEIFRLQTDDWPTSVEAMCAYLPKPLEVPLIYFAADHSAAAWQRVSSNIVNIRLSGDHSDAVRDPANLATIADDAKRRFQARA